MAWSDTTIESLRRIFRTGFTVRDICEPLVSLDASTLATDALAAMEQNNVTVLGVQRSGIVEGYAERHGLTGFQTCGDGLRRFDNSAIIPDSNSLADTISALDKSPRLFVSAEGTVVGIVTTDDL